MKTMLMSELYSKMKNAIDFFGLRFHDMDKIIVIFSEDAITFEFNGSTVSYSLK